MIYCENINYCTYKFNNLEKLTDSQKDKDIWAFAYKEDERALNLLCKPIKGQIKDITFYEYKSNGKNLKKNGTKICSRYFADTYEEAANGFNVLISQRIESLREEISRLEDMIIK